MNALDKVLLSIERLLRNSGHSDWNITSVVCESRMYCYKTVGGKIGVVDISFIDQRVSCLQY